MTKKTVREVITHIVFNNRPVPKTYLLKDEEAYTVATSGIDGAHGIPRDATSLTNELQQVIHGVGKPGPVKKLYRVLHKCMPTESLNR